MDALSALNQVNTSAAPPGNAWLRAVRAQSGSSSARPSYASLAQDVSRLVGGIEGDRAPLVANSAAIAARQRTIEEMRTLLRALLEGESDPESLTDLIFYARHPEMIGADLTGDHSSLDEWNIISSFLVHPLLDEVGEVLNGNALLAGGEAGRTTGWNVTATGLEPIGAKESGAQFLPGTGTFPGSGPGSVPGSGRLAAGSRLDSVIGRAAMLCPGLSPALLKSLLVQESGLRPNVINSYGYAGIAQFGTDEAREAGLHVGMAGSASDERLNPYRAIPAAARLLDKKAQRLGEIAFARYGTPAGMELWRYILAAYNGGEGTVALAMGHAYRAGIARARAEGLVGSEVITFARDYASQWANLTGGGLGSPLGQSVARHFPGIALSKYREISQYATNIVIRSIDGLGL